MFLFCFLQLFNSSCQAEGSAVQYLNINDLSYHIFVTLKIHKLESFSPACQGIIILLVAAESFMSGMKNRLIFKAAEEDEKAKSAVKSDSDSASAEVKAVSTDTDTAKKIAAVGDDGGGTSSDETKKEDPSL